jgi:hypothetical protein
MMQHIIEFDKSEGIIYLSIYQSNYLYINLSIYLITFYLSIYLSISLGIVPHGEVSKRVYTGI